MVFLAGTDDCQRPNYTLRPRCCSGNKVCMNRKARKKPLAPRQQLRIIGGRLRSARFSFVAAQGLRPTGDRTRETLFNWLAARIPGAHCLDLFAGSGALAFEALSRGAAGAVALESNKPAAQGIRREADRLGLDGLQVIGQHALQWIAGQALAGQAQVFDIAFLDPPFDDRLLDAACKSLEQSGLLAGNAFIYTESEYRAAPPDVPGNWRLFREKRFGEARAALYNRQAPGHSGSGGPP